jgi:hypothetical protein
MTLLVDPSQRGSAADQRSADDTTAAPPSSIANLGVQPLAVQAATAASPDVAVADAVAAPPRLAEPPITGGRVEALMGRLIGVLSHSPLARPLPAVVLSLLGLSGVAFIGLCATAPRPSVATAPVLLPLTSVARNLGAPHLPDLVASLIMYVAIALCCLGLAMMLWANSRGWSPSPRKVFWSAAAAVAVVVNITPVGSSDAASYAAYGRIAALGYNPYTFNPAQLPGGQNNPYTMLVSPMWRTTYSVYGPVATWTHLFAATIGGAKPWLAIWVMMMIIGAAFVAAGYVLLRTAANPVRAVLLWVANPLLIAELVMGGHLDALVALFAIVAVVLSRRCARLWHEVGVGLLVGVAGGIKVSAVFVALGIAIPLLHDRAFGRLVRIGAIAGATTLGLYYFSYGLVALRPLGHASTMVISPTIWRGVQEIGSLATRGSTPAALATHAHVEAMINTGIGFAWPAVMMLLAWYLYNRLSPDVPTVVAASCALTFAWVLVAPWSLPWYSSVAWVTLALLPRNSLTRWLTLVTGVLALLHFNGGHSTNVQSPTP